MDVGLSKPINHFVSVYESDYILTHILNNCMHHIKDIDILAPSRSNANYILHNLILFHFHIINIM